MAGDAAEVNDRTMPGVPLRRRLGVLAALFVLYALAVVLGGVSFPSYRNASGALDLGHYFIPSLLDLVGEQRAEYVWWLGTLPLELFFAAIALVVLFTGKGVRLALCLYAMYALHWLFLHATTLPPPDHIVWRFPAGVFTLGKPYENDLWFSGHTANAFVIALATEGYGPWLRAIAWGGLAFEILLVLSARTHYTIDVLGGLFVGYTTHRISLDVFARTRP